MRTAAAGDSGVRPGGPGSVRFAVNEPMPDLGRRVMIPTEGPG